MEELNSGSFDSKFNALNHSAQVNFKKASISLSPTSSPLDLASLSFSCKSLILSPSTFKKKKKYYIDQNIQKNMHKKINKSKTFVKISFYHSAWKSQSAR